MTLWTRLQRRPEDPSERDRYKREAAQAVNRNLHDAFVQLGPPQGWQPHTDQPHPDR